MEHWSILIYYDSSKLPYLVSIAYQLGYKTITFMLPGEYRVLFAALLGVALGVILAIGARKK